MLNAQVCNNLFYVGNNRITVEVQDIPSDSVINVNNKFIEERIVIRYNR